MKITFDINNGNRQVWEQAEHDGDIALYKLVDDFEEDDKIIIPAGDMVMLGNMYRYIKTHDIYNPWINPNGNEKEGHLLELPCEVGDTVYFAAWFGTRPHIVKSISLPQFFAVDAEDCRSDASFSASDFGKSVFFTREEAEKALEEVEA